MPAGITIIAKIDGKTASCQVVLPHLDWIGLEIDSNFAEGILPERICEVVIGSEKGIFREVFPSQVFDSSRWGKIKRWWKDRRYGRSYD